MLKSAKANSSLEDGVLWVYFDLEFQKPLLTPDMLVQTWHESRVPAYMESPNILRVVDSIPDSKDEVFSRTKSLDFIVEGHISEKSGGKSIEVIIIRPDDSSLKLHATTNEKGYYRLPVKLSDTWLEGNYKVISKFRGVDIGTVEFSVSDKTDKGFGGTLPQTGFLDRLFRDYLEGQISLEAVNSVLSEKKFPSTAIDVIDDRLEIHKSTFFTKKSLLE